MSLSSLQVLADNRQALLLAEVAALLHDWQKCIDMAVASNWQKNPRLRGSKKVQEWQQRGKSLKPGEFADSLSTIQLSLAGYPPIDLKTLCEEGREPSSAARHSHLLVQLLGSAHDLAHVDKELNPQEQTDKACDQTSTAFGFETIGPGELLNPLLLTVKPLLDRLNLPNDRAQLLGAIQEVFSKAWGDTRRPINEVTLWDWGYAVAGLYKSLSATNLLGIGHSHWRLLRVNFDVLGLYAKAIKIADLLGYQRAVQETCERVKKLVEEEYPLGNEVYRDTTGLYFTFPDLDLPADLAQEIRRRVEEVEPELAPRIAVTVGDGATATEQLKGILAKARKEAVQTLAQPFDGQNLSAYWQQQWETVGDGNWELCPVCRLRPRAASTEVCKVCEQRRGSRIERWKQKPDRTIWLDEIGDHNGRVALLVGKFDLDDWLTGDLVQTMLVKAEPNNPAGCTPKNASPARLRRVWETCAQFWSVTVVGGILAQREYGKDTKNARLRRIRWLIVPDKKNGWKENVPYDGTVNGKPISLLWRDDAKYFVTISNLQLTGELEPGQTITVNDPDEPRRRIEFTVQGVMQAMGEMSAYTPFLPLLSSPDQFLGLVPAADALEIANKIREEYTKQFGKVQNRLPFFLGLVFFPRKMPLMAVMDAGRRMLDVTLQEEQWRIKQNVANGQVAFANGAQWDVPTVMGDDSTPDDWYPYFFVTSVDPARHTRRFQLRREGDGDSEKVGAVSAKHADRWLVHVEDLKENDVVGITPSRFAYLWLEHTAKRFEFDAQKGLLWLDELPRLMRMWEQIRETPEMTDTKLRGVQALLEAKSAAWGETSDEFQKLARTTLERAGMLNAVTLEDVSSGRFARCLELHTKILKLRLKEVHNERQPETTNA